MLHCRKQVGCGSRVVLSRTVGRCAEPRKVSRCQRRLQRGGRAGTALRAWPGWWIARRGRIAAHGALQPEQSGASSKSGCMRRWGPAASVICWVCIPRRCIGCLPRYGLAKLRWLDRADRAGHPSIRTGPLRVTWSTSTSRSSARSPPAVAGACWVARRQPQLLADKSQSRNKPATRARLPLPAHRYRRAFAAGLQRTARR